MARVVAVANQKGGVGKTTTAVNVAAALALSGKRVLLLDLDPQGNATAAVGVPRQTAAFVPAALVLDLAEDAPAVQPVPVETSIAGLWLVPAGPSLADIEPLLWKRDDRAERLRRGIARVREKYDWIFIDCPPGLGVLPLVALVAADSVLLPIQCEFFAMDGLAQALETIRKAKKKHNPALEIEGVLLTMHDVHAPHAREVERQVREFSGEQVFETIVPRDESLVEAASHGKPVVLYKPCSRGTRAYVELARELLARSQVRAS